MTKQALPATTWRLVLALGTLVVGACNSGPSDGEITAAVSEVAVKSRGLNPLTGKDSSDCGVMHGKITEVTKVEVTERGAHNEKDGYWPAKLRLSGKCEAQKPNCGSSKNQPCPPEPATFEGVELEVRLKKSDSGKWSVAEVVGGDAAPVAPNARVAASSVEPPSLSIDPKAVTEVVLTVKGAAPVTLKKDGSTWKANDAEANQANVATLIDHLGKLKTADVIAGEAGDDELAKYELDDEHAAHVVVRPLCDGRGQAEAGGYAVGQVVASVAAVHVMAHERSGALYQVNGPLHVGRQLGLRRRCRNRPTAVHEPPPELVDVFKVLDPGLERSGPIASRAAPTEVK